MHSLKLAFFSGAILVGTLPAIAVDSGFSAALRSSQGLAATHFASSEATVQRIRAGAAVSVSYDAPEGSNRVHTASYRNPEGAGTVIIASFSHPEGTNSFQTARSMTHESNFEPVFA